MNESTLKELKIVVERAVRPVRATMVRKRKMREELLAHLTAAFEEELARSGDEEAALHQATRRFGDPREVSAELADSVSRLERVRSIGDYYWIRGADEPLRRLAARQILLMGGPYAVAALVIPPILMLRGRQTDMGTVFYVLVLLGVAMTTFSLVAAILSDLLARAMYGGDCERSWRAAAAYAIASLCIFPAMGFLFYWACSGDVLMSLDQFRLGCCFAPVAPVVLIMLARQVAYEREWATLRIGE